MDPERTLPDFSDDGSASWMSTAAAFAAGLVVSAVCAVALFGFRGKAFTPDAEPAATAPSTGAASSAASTSGGTAAHPPPQAPATTEDTDGLRRRRPSFDGEWC